MLALYGDSMLSGFPTTREIPQSCIAPHTVLSDEPLVTIPQAMREDGIEVECCALPGFTSAQVLEWFNLTPQWRCFPSVFWFGRCEKPIDPARIVEAHAYMIERMTAPWWVCALPVTANEVARQTTGLVELTNEMLQKLAGDRFLDPLRAIGAAPVLPLDKRMDSFHPNSEANRLIARWLIGNTVGALARAA
jgi:hypothetical protein